MNEDYTQPFYVGINNTRFPHRSIGGYLSALEPDEEPIFSNKEEEPWSKRQWDVITQLRLDQINLRKTLYDTLKEIKERANASKRKTQHYNPF